MWPTFFIPNGTTFPGGVIFVEAAEPTCGTSTSYNPASNTPLAQEGDIAIWFVVGSNMTGTSKSMNEPTGWKIYRLASTLETFPYARPMAVFYKQLTADDLAVTHVTSRASGSTATLCSRVVVLRDCLAETPISYHAVSAQQFFADADGEALTISSPAMMYSGVGFLMSVGVLRFAVDSPANGWLSATTYGPEQDWEPTDANTGRYWWRFRGRVASSDTASTNLIAGETAASSGVTGWTATNIGTRTANQTQYTGGPAFTVLTADTATGRHYIEYEVSLTAGQEYQFSAQLMGKASSPFYNSPGLSVLPPTGSEFGQIFYSDGTPASQVSPTGALNAAAWWEPAIFTADEDGAGSFMAYWGCLAFTAQETGTHKLRVNVCNGFDGWEHSTANTIRLLHAGLSNKWGVPYPVYTGSGAVLDGNSDDYCPAVFHSFSGVPTNWLSNGQETIMGFAAIPASTPQPEIRLVPYEGGQRPIQFSADGLTASTTDGSDEAASVVASRVVYPTKDGSAGQYYMEFTVTDTFGTPTSASGAYIGAPHSCPPNTAVGSERQYYYKFNGAIGYAALAPTTYTAWTEGDVIGIAVDYSAATIAWYHNGTLQATQSMNTGADYKDTSQPMQFHFCLGNSDGNGVRPTANFKGPFTYTPPTSHVAWDWANEA